MGRRRSDRGAGPSGVLIVDKPRGPTSHDVVRWARRALGTRAIGHAGTLDPMATGVLVLAVGEGTKLVPYLTAADKEYEAEVLLGTQTDTLDAEGMVTEQAPVPADLDLSVVERVARGFVGTLLQVPPVVSAIKVDGRPSYERARKGEKVEPVARQVALHSVQVRSVSANAVCLKVVCGKGFYVRSLARDLALELGTVGHLSALRRTRSGAHHVDGAVPGDLLRQAGADDEARANLMAHLYSLSDAWGGAPRALLNDVGVEDARQGRQVGRTGLLDPTLLPFEEGTVVALFDHSGRMVALARPAEDADHGPTLRVVRGVKER